MPVDYASNPWKLDETYAFASKNGLRVVEDAAHAFGCKHHRKKNRFFLGTSFASALMASKHYLRRRRLYNCLSERCCHIMRRRPASGGEKETRQNVLPERDPGDPDVVHQGWRYHLSNIMAAIGIVQLKRLETEFIPARRRLYELYRQKLSDIENVAFFVTDPDDFIVPHILPLRILEEKRQLVANDLQARGIPTGMHYKPNHLLSLFGGGANRLPNVEKIIWRIAYCSLASMSCGRRCDFGMR